MIGQTISHYKILEKLGEGGMGVVYKAEDTKLKRTVALKFLPPLFSTDDEVKQRFIQEAQAASALNHTNICSIHAIEESEKQQFIDMEFVDGKTLSVLLKEKELSLKDVVDIADQIAQGLNAAHKKGIVHRDIKPENIMLADDGGTVKIMDFGLAKLKGATKLTKAGSTLGTAAYMSPEQARGEEVDQRSDIFSFGVVSYEMLAGRPPFRGEHAAALMYSITNEEPAPLARYNEQVSEELQHIVSKALEKDKEDRYQHVDEMLADLRRERKTLEYAKSGYIKAGEPNQVVPSERVQSKRNIVRVILAAATVLVLVVLVFLFNPFKKSTEQTPIGTKGQKSIAVLPFVDMSPQKDQEYFCDGMTEELINRLSNVQELHVPARTSVFTFKGKAADIREVGSKLDVQTVLEGSVQKSGGRLRITAQLINVADGYHLWSEKYDREFKDVFAIQDEISSAIVDALQLKLTSQEVESIAERPIDNVKAYDCYLKAEHQILRFDQKSLDSAFAYLQTGIDIMGDNAELDAGMAYASWQYANIGMGQEEYLNRSEVYAKKALALKPGLSSALTMLGLLSMYENYPQNIHDAFRYFKKASAANPFELMAGTGTTVAYAMIGKPADVYPTIKRMEHHDPLNPWWHLIRGRCYMYDCQFQPALEQTRLYYRADSTSPLGEDQYSWALAWNGRRDEALAVIDRAGVETPDNVQTVFYLILKFALLKNREGALNVLTPAIKKTCRRDPEWSYLIASRLSLADAKKEALDWLENAIGRGFVNYPLFQCDPFFNNIRGEERFKALMEKAKDEWEHFEVPE
jgi:serine/threonine protein kinase